MVLTLLVAYLLGSVSGSLLLGRRIGVDIRHQGSGNAGGTNAFRTQGWRFALGVVLIDIGKGALATGFTVWVQTRWGGGLASGSYWVWWAVLCAAAGHTWPVFHGFRGGKGVGTMVGGLGVVWPMSLLPCLLVWLLTLTTTGYVGLASVLATLVLVPMAWFWGDAPVWFALSAAGFIVFTHRLNLRRLVAGREHRFPRARIWRRGWLYLRGLDPNA